MVRDLRDIICGSEHYCLYLLRVVSHTGDVEFIYSFLLWCDTLIMYLNVDYWCENVHGVVSDCTCAVLYFQYEDRCLRNQLAVQGLVICTLWRFSSLSDSGLHVYFPACSEILPNI